MAGELKPAAQILHKLAVLQPQFPMIHVMSAQAFHEAGAPSDEIFDELNKAQRASPSDPDVYYLRGKICVESGRLQEAVESLTQAIKLQPATPDYYYQLGLAYQRMGKQAIAQEQFKKKLYLDQISPNP
jgi:predicted Zn-dependent protease